MVINYNTALFFYEKDGKIVYVGRILNAGPFNDLNEWRNFRIGFGGYLGSGQYVAFRRFKVVYTTIAGIRDPNIVTDKYGAPLIDPNGRFYFTATLASHGGEIPSAGHALFSSDFEGNVRLEKIILTRRVDRDNRVYGDHASHIVYDPDTGKFIVLNSSWVSESPCRLLLGFTDMDIRSRGPIVIDMTKINLAPNSGSSAYDPFLIFDLDANKWRLVFVNPFPNIFVYENTEVRTDGWTEVSRATFTGITEGCKMFKVNGKWYVGLGKSDETPYMVAVDYPTLTNKVKLNADLIHGTPGSPPHPTVVPVPVGNMCKYLIVTMDVTDPRANLVIFEADKMNDGYEYPILILE